MNESTHGSCSDAHDRSDGDQHEVEVTRVDAEYKREKDGPPVECPNAANSLGRSSCGPAAHSKTATFLSKYLGIAAMERIVETAR